MADFRMFLSGVAPEPNINPSTAILAGLGTETYPATIATADKKFMSFYLKNDATSGDNRGLYLRLFLGGAGGGGEAARFYTDVYNVAAGTAHGAHISLGFGTTGSITGLGVAGRNTLHIPTSGSAAGTLAAIQAEIYSDGSVSDPAGATELSYIRVVNGGDATGMADVDTDAFFLSVQGFTAGAGKMVHTGPPATLAASLKCKVGATTYYLPLYSGES